MQDKGRRLAEQADALEREDDEFHQPEPEGLEPDAPDADEADALDPEQPEGDEPEGEFEISFGDEAAPASTGTNSDLVRHLRSEVRKRDEELAAYRTGRVPALQPQTIEVGAKPTLESCDYDGDKFEAELLAWTDRKRQADEAQAQSQKRANAEQARFAERLQGYQGAKSALGAKDFEVAEAAVTSKLTQVQQAVLIKAAGDPAKLVYALGRHPGKLATLAAVEDPIEFTAALVKLEGTLKVTNRGRTPPEPDTPVRGAGSYTPKSDPALERLEREAARTGDRTAIRKYRQAQRDKAQGK